MEDHELIRTGRKRCVCPALIVAKLYFKHIGRKGFNHRTNLSTT